MKYHMYNVKSGEEKKVFSLPLIIVALAWKRPLTSFPPHTKKKKIHHINITNYHKRVGIARPTLNKKEIKSKKIQPKKQWTLWKI